MVRDPSIVSPTLTGVFIGGGHNKHGAGSRCTLQKQCRPPSPRRRWRCDRSSYKRNLFSRIRVSPRTTSLGLRPLRRFPSPSRIHVESNHSGMGKRHHRPKIRAIQAVAAAPRVGSGTGCSQPARWSAGRPSKASVGGGGPRYFRRSCRSRPGYRHRQTDLTGSLNGPHTTPRRVPQ